MITLSEQIFRVSTMKRSNGAGGGFTLLELLVTLSILAVLVALTTPLFASYYGECCLKAMMWEVAGMIKDAKQNALSEKYYAISFNPVQGRISLVSDRGADGEWNTADDEIVRSVRLRDMGGGLSFGYGSHGPLPTLAPAPDGISFPNNNTLICNPDLTSNAGTVYIQTRLGAAMALTVNSTDFSYKLWRWSGTAWVKM
jgi:prepilin-type N-terminal cleavage/methylation domain-containing protein